MTKRTSEEILEQDKELVEIFQDNGFSKDDAVDKVRDFVDSVEDKLRELLMLRAEAVSVLAAQYEVDDDVVSEYFYLYEDIVKTSEPVDDSE